MRQAINNLQSTWTGLGLVNADNVFKVCDQPHPITIRAMLTACQKGDIDDAMEHLDRVWGDGYAAVDIIGTLFKVVKTMDQIPEAMKLEFIKVRSKRQREKTKKKNWRLSLRIDLQELTSGHIAYSPFARKLAGPTCASSRVCLQ